jgi:hypothetical protein
LFAVGLGLLTGAGCADDDGVLNVSDNVTFPELQTRLEVGTTRLRVELQRQGDLWVARGVRIKEREDIDDREQIRSPLAQPGFQELDQEGDACRGTLALELEPLQVQFAREQTNFRVEGRGTVTCTQFVATVNARIERGQSARIRARRVPPLQQTQAPDDPVFIARELRLDTDSLQRPNLQVNADRRHLKDCGRVASPTAQCFGVLELFAVPIVVDEEQTDLDAEDTDGLIEVDFRGVVADVDQKRGAFSFRDGTVVRLVTGTRLATGNGDDRATLTSLEAVANALQQDRTVEARGEGVISQSVPLEIVATELRFERDRNGAQQPFEGVQFDGTVVDADPAQRMLTLAAGGRVHIPSDEIINPQGDLQTYENVVGALQAGRQVRMRGTAAVQSRKPSTILVATSVRFDVREGR